MLQKKDTILKIGSHFMFKKSKTKPKLPSEAKCCGCSACYASCPAKAISMVADKEGFLQPHIDKKLCIGCGKCENACPVLHQNPPRTPIEVFASRAKDEETLVGSSSGGIFTLLAKKTIANGGVVFGAAWEYPSCKVRHIAATTYTDLDMLRGSKYLQSEMGNIFQEVKQALKNDCKVIFSGCPCQIAGLKKYLGEDNANLLTVDIICHGVPSPLAWNAFLKQRENESGEKVSKVISRRYCSWVNFNLSLQFQSLEKKYSKSYPENSFLVGFLQNYFLRKCCHQCSFRELRSKSDITLGDAWGFEKQIPDFNDDKGISTAIINTTKGKNAFSQILDDIQKYDISFEETCNSNPTILGNYKKTWRRKKFFTLIKKMDFDSVISKLNSSGFFRKCHLLLWWLKRLIINREVNKLW